MIETMTSKEIKEPRKKLKCIPEFFGDVKLGVKSFEVRKNDRDYQVDDVLVIQEYLPNEGCYTGNEVTVKITYILTAEQFSAGLQPGYVVLGIVRI